MKKLLVLLLALTLALALAACGNQNPMQEIPQNEAVEQSQLPQSEPIDKNTSEKEVLELENFSEALVVSDFEEDYLPETKSISLPHMTLNERNESVYGNEEELDVLVQFIKDTLGVEIDSRWKVFVHYYDMDKTVGMVQFLYTVGEINTNRSIVFNIKEGKYDTAYYKCLSEKIDETDLMNRVAAFKNKYVQGKRTLQDGETFYEEQTNFVYYINADKLVYSYAYFFQYDIGVVNNDWGTIRIINENGDAVSVS